MAFQVSPGVNTSEIDLTNVVIAAGTSTGGFAGRFRWGPIEEITLVTDEDNLVDQFQKPDDNNFEVTVIFDIIGQEFPTQEFSFILEATR